MARETKTCIHCKEPITWHDIFEWYHGDITGGWNTSCASGGNRATPDYEPELKKNKMVVDENTSDGFHTFKELYEMRLLLTAGLFNEWGEDAHEFQRNSPLVFKSKLHSDGTIPFNDPNWFIVVAETREGQISFHYEVKDWDLFYAVPEVTLPPTYDGHTAADVAVRLRKLLGG